MTTAYTSLLGLALPVTGELSGTWGDTVNTAITSLLDTAIAGTTSITTDADITLSTTTGASNQARQAIILWNPASGTTTRNITAPAQSKMYVVINASGGTQSIVIRGAGPTTGVTILKGESATVAWNGSDFVKVSSSGGGLTLTDLTVTGNTTLGDTSNDTLTVNATSTFNSPVSFAGLVRLPSTGRSAAAALTVTAPAFLYGVASTYTDTTSSGTIAAMAPFYALSAPTLSTSNVTTYSFASTLYLAGAPAAGGSATITNPYALYVNSGANYFGGATALGSTLTVAGATTLNGNVTLGDASGDTITINGTTTFANVNPTFTAGTANGVLYLNGSKVATSGSALTFNGTTLGLLASTATMSVKSSTAGSNSVVVADTSSTDVASLFRTDINGTTTGYIGAGGATYPNLGGNNSLFLWNVANGPVVFAVNNGEKMRIGSAVGGVGAVGIGYTDLTSAGNNGLAVLGSVSIGTSTGSTYTGAPKLTVYGNQGSQFFAYIRNDSASAFASSAIAINAYGNTWGIECGSAAKNSNSLTFQLDYGGANANKMTLTAGGTLGVGNFTPYSTWGNSYVAIQVANGSRSLAATGAGSGDLTLAFNAVYDSTDSRWEFAGTGDKALRYSQTGNGEHIWYTTGTTGVAGNPITFNQAMTLNVNGLLALGTTQVNTGFSVWSANAVTGYTIGNQNGTMNVLDYTTPSAVGVGGRIVFGSTYYINGNTIGTGYIGTYKENAPSNGSNEYDHSLTFGATSSNFTNGREVGRFTSAGDFGVNTTSPQGRVESKTSNVLPATSAYAQKAFVANIPYSTSNITSSMVAAYDGTIHGTDIGYAYNGSGYYLAFATNNTTTGSPTERARIGSNGKVYFNGTSEAGSGDSVVTITATNATGLVRALALETWSTSSIIVQTFRNPNGQVGDIETSGSSTAYVTSSDYRLKEDVQPMTGALAKVALLKPVVYKWKVDGSDGQGFIAHELQAVCPDAVSGEKDALDEKGNIKPQGIDTSFLVATLTAALQELNAKFDAYVASHP